MAATKSSLLVSLLLVLCCSSATSLPMPSIYIVCRSVWDMRNSSFSISVNWTLASSVPVDTINVFQINFDQFKGEESIATRFIDIPPKMDTYSYSLIENNIVPYAYIDPTDDGSTSLTGYYYIESVFNDVDGSAPNDVRGGCEVPLSPTRPSQPTAVEILQFDIQVHVELTVAIIRSVSLQWSLPSNPVVTDASSLGYQMWVGFTDPGFTFDMKDIITINETVRNGFVNGNSVPLSVPPIAKHIFVKMRCYYELITGSSETHRIYSNWSTPNPYSIVSTDTPTTTSITTSETIATHHEATNTQTTTKNIVITRSTQEFSPAISSLRTNRISLPTHSTSPSPYNNDTFSMSKGGLVSAGISNGMVIIIAVTIPIALLLAVIVVIIGFLVVCISRRRKLRTLCHELDSKVPSGLENDCSFFKGGKLHCSMTMLPQQQSVLVLEGGPAVDEWELPTNAVIIQKRLGRGCFGEVFKGEVKGFKNAHLVSYETRNNNGRFVAIKILKNNASNQEKNDFLEEIELMKVIAKGHNPHVVNMLGAVTRQEPMCLVTEYLEHGDLLAYLRNTQCHYDNVSEIGHRELPESVDFTSFAYQIASGMDYLSSLKIIHRDLACRNILVGEGKVLKVSDFGLSRNTAYNSAYVKTSNGPLPIRWMAIESIMYHQFTTASDVWSFGITLWEIGTLGAVPYPNIDNSDILRALQNGNRVDKPSTITDEAYKIMTTCFAEDPKQRPTFCELRKTFDLIFSKDKNIKDMYLDLCLTSEPKLAALTSPITNRPTSNVYVDN